MYLNWDCKETGVCECDKFWHAICSLSSDWVDALCGEFGLLLSGCYKRFNRFQYGKGSHRVPHLPTPGLVAMWTWDEWRQVVFTGCQVQERIQIVLLLHLIYILFPNFSISSLIFSLQKYFQNSFGVLLCNPPKLETKHSNSNLQSSCVPFFKAKIQLNFFVNPFSLLVPLSMITTNLSLQSANLISYTLHGTDHL